MAVQHEARVEQAIVAASLDYYEGWFEGDASRMERALHPDLVKRSLAEDGLSVETLSARDMIDGTARGVGRTRDPGPESRMIEVHVDHVFGDIATVTTTSAVYSTISSSLGPARAGRSSTPSGPGSRSRTATSGVMWKGSAAAAKRPPSGICATGIRASGFRSCAS